MFELDAKDVKDIVQKHVSGEHEERLLEAFNSTEVTAEDFDAIGEALSTDPDVITKQFDPHLDKSGVSLHPNYWQLVKGEIYKLICTGDDTTIWEAAKQGFESLVKSFVTALSAKCKIEVALLTSLVTVAVIMVYKVSANIWCHLQQPEAAPTSS